MYKRAEELANSTFQISTTGYRKTIYGFCRKVQGDSPGISVGRPTYYKIVMNDGIVFNVPGQFRIDVL